MINFFRTSLNTTIKGYIPKLMTCYKYLINWCIPAGLIKIKNIPMCFYESLPKIVLILIKLQFLDLYFTL